VKPDDSARRYIGGHAAPRDYGYLSDAVDRKRDQVPLTVGLHLDPALGAIEHEGHGDDRLEGVALGPRSGAT